MAALRSSDSIGHVCEVFISRSCSRSLTVWVWFPEATRKVEGENWFQQVIFRLSDSRSNTCTHQVYAQWYTLKSEFEEGMRYDCSSLSGLLLLLFKGRSLNQHGKQEHYFGYFSFNAVVTITEKKLTEWVMWMNMLNCVVWIQWTMSLMRNWLHCFLLLHTSVIWNSSVNEVEREWTNEPVNRIQCNCGSLEALSHCLKMNFYLQLQLFFLY